MRPSLAPSRPPALRPPRRRGRGPLANHYPLVAIRESLRRQTTSFPSMERETDDRVRLDKWLWAARFFKTRALAAEAIDGGKVDVNDARVKRAKLVQVGDEVRVRQTPFEHVVKVRDGSERRGRAS